MKVLGIRWLAGSAVTALALVASAEAVGAASHIDISTTCEGVTLSVRGARWIQQIDVEVDGEIVSIPWADVANGEAWDSVRRSFVLSPGPHEVRWSDDGWDHSEAETIHWHDAISFTVPRCEVWPTTTVVPTTIAPMAPSTTTAPSTTATTILATTTLAPTTVTEVLSTDVEPLPSLHRPSAVTTSTSVDTTVAFTTPPTMPVPVAVLDATTSTVYVVPDGVADVTTTSAPRATGRLASTGVDPFMVGILCGFGAALLGVGIAAVRIGRAQRCVNVRKP